MAALNDEETRAWQALMRLTGALPRLLENDLERSARVSLSEFALLVTLAESREGSRRMTDLARAGRLSPSRATRVAIELEKRGLVQRQKSEDDARGSLATITDRGRQAVDEAFPVQVDRAREILFDQLDGEQLSALCHVLEDLVVQVSTRS